LAASFDDEGDEQGTETVKTFWQPRGKSCISAIRMFIDHCPSSRRTIILDEKNATEFILQHFQHAKKKKKKKKKTAKSFQRERNSN
jgi:hypothetical protein